MQGKGRPKSFGFKRKRSERAQADACAQPTFQSQNNNNSGMDFEKPDLQQFASLLAALNQQQQEKESQQITQTQYLPASNLNHICQTRQDVDRVFMERNPFAGLQKNTNDEQSQSMRQLLNQLSKSQQSGSLPPVAPQFQDNFIQTQQKFYNGINQANMLQRRYNDEYDFGQRQQRTKEKYTGNYKYDDPIANFTTNEDVKSSVERLGFVQGKQAQLLNRQQTLQNKVLDMEVKMNHLERVHQSQMESMKKRIQYFEQLTNNTLKSVLFGKINQSQQP